jgi:hypothetical protein
VTARIQNCTWHRTGTIDRVSMRRSIAFAVLGPRPYAPPKSRPKPRSGRPGRPPLGYHLIPREFNSTLDYVSTVRRKLLYLPDAIPWRPLHVASQHRTRAFTSLAKRPFACGNRPILRRIGVIAPANLHLPTARRPRSMGRSISTIHPYPIDLVYCGKMSGRIWILRPIPTNCHISDHVHGPMHI